MKTPLNNRDLNDALNHLNRLRAERELRSRNLSAYQVIAYSSDAFRMALGEDHLTSATTSKHTSNHHQLRHFGV